MSDIDTGALEQALVGLGDQEIVMFEGRIRAAQLSADITVLQELISDDLLFTGPIAGFSGAVGEMVFAAQEKKVRILASMKKHYEPSQAHLDWRARFKEASQYADVALEDPAARAFFASGANRNSPSREIIK